MFLLCFYMMSKC